MNAVQFIQKHGVEKVREVVGGAKDYYDTYNTGLGGGYIRCGGVEENHVNISDIKRLIASVMLVDSYGGIDSCRNIIYMLHELTEDPEPIRQAIADYESIYGEML